MAPSGIFALAVYGLVWFVVLYAVLPIGVRTQKDEGKVIDGTEPSAPIAPRLRIKFFATSIIAGLITAAGYGVWVWLAGA